MSKHTVGRRNFLTGASSLVAIPLLESLLPREAWSQQVTAPKRFTLFSHSEGRCVGHGLVDKGVMQDVWSPRTTSGPLPAGLSPMLAPLEAVRDEVVTVDKVDN